MYLRKRFANIRIVNYLERPLETEPSENNWHQIIFEICRKWNETSKTVTQSFIIKNISTNAKLTSIEIDDVAET